MRATRLSATAGLLYVAAGAVWSFSDDRSDNGPSEQQADRIISAVDTTERPSDSPPLIVHEWGTFTSFSGSDGVKLEFRPLVDRDLPPFVHNRLDQAGISFAKRSIATIQRMETPVTYFYTPVERDVSVRVDFPDGLLTEFYPPVRNYGPPIDDSANWSENFAQGRVQTAVPLKNSMLDWGEVHLIPPEALRAHVADEELSRRIGRHVERTMLPETGGYGHYAAARNTDSAIVQFRQTSTDGSGNVISGIDYFEKFLFYRGVGNFELPVMLEARDNGDFLLTNAGPDELRSLFLVTVRGEEIRFRQAGRLAAESTLLLTQSESTSTIDELASHVAEALRAEGLYEKEAWSMVNTWRSSWFGEEGTRLFYILPQRVTDELLPLTVEPAPDEMIRILVGRMEITPPETEREVLRLLGESAAARVRHDESQSDQPFVSPAFEKLIAMGRLAEPVLVRARYIADSDEIRDEAVQLVADLRSRQDTEAPH